jgi:hypothetical protein
MNKYFFLSYFASWPWWQRILLTGCMVFVCILVWGFLYYLLTLHGEELKARVTHREELRALNQRLLHKIEQIQGAHSKHHVGADGNEFCPWLLNVLDTNLLQLEKFSHDRGGVSTAQEKVLLSVQGPVEGVLHLLEDLEVTTCQLEQCIIKRIDDVAISAELMIVIA